MALVWRNSFKCFANFRSALTKPVVALEDPQYHLSLLRQPLFRVSFLHSLSSNPSDDSIFRQRKNTCLIVSGESVCTLINLRGKKRGLIWERGEAIRTVRAVNIGVFRIPTESAPKSNAIRKFGMSETKTVIGAPQRDNLVKVSELFSSDFVIFDSFKSRNEKFNGRK